MLYDVYRPRSFCHDDVHHHDGDDVGQIIIVSHANGKKFEKVQRNYEMTAFQPGDIDCYYSHDTVQFLKLLYEYLFEFNVTFVWN